jgi:hypothetical protein
MVAFVFEPIRVKDNAPGGACEFRTFDDISAFVLTTVPTPLRLAPHWVAVQRDLAQARFGARRSEVHQAMRDALSKEGWLA